MVVIRNGVEVIDRVMIVLNRLVVLGVISSVFLVWVNSMKLNLLFWLSSMLSVSVLC